MATPKSVTSTGGITDVVKSLVAADASSASALASGALKINYSPDKNYDDYVDNGNQYMFVSWANARSVFDGSTVYNFMWGVRAAVYLSTSPVNVYVYMQTDLGSGLSGNYFNFVCAASSATQTATAAAGPS